MHEEVFSCPGHKRYRTKQLLDLVSPQLERPCSRAITTDAAEAVRKQDAGYATTVENSVETPQKTAARTAM
jgi:hypothetical protein